MIDRETLAVYVKKHYAYNPNSGRVQHINRDRDVKGTVIKTGYCTMTFYVNGEKMNLQFHRVVWLLCHGRWPTQIDHIDGNPLNNRVENLREVSQSENDANRLWPWKPNAVTGLPSVFYDTRNNRFSIRLGRLYHFHDKHQAFVMMVLMGRMFKVEEL